MEGRKMNQERAQIYSYSVRRMDGGETSLSEYRGKVLLLVNTASRCGFTPQFAQLESLYEKYRDRGLMVLAFPCNQFKEQDPDDDETIARFCQKNYGVTFPVFSKIKVLGSESDALYRYLTEQKPFAGFDRDHPLAQKLHEILSAEDPDYARSDAVKWNFTKFLVGRDGAVMRRFEPTADLAAVEREIEKLL